MWMDALKPELHEMINARNWTGLRDVLADWPAPEVADLLRELSKSDRVLLFRALPRERAADAFSHLEVEEQDRLLRDMTDEETRALLAELSPDDRTHLLEELPGQATQRLLNLLSHEDLKEARWLMGYPEESVGRLMTPDYVVVRRHWTVQQTLRQVRRKGLVSETINWIYVVDDDWRLIDDIELRKLILAEPESEIEEVMDHSFVSVSAFADREEAVELIQRYDMTALPVVDSAGVLVGIVTVDDVLDVAEAEATEDFHNFGSVGPIKTSLLEASILFVYRRRIGWLMGLVFMNIFSSAGIAYYEDTIEAMVGLVFFLPLLIGSGGNAGSQSATLVIRALATGDVEQRDWLKLLTKELVVALAIGATMAVGVSLIAQVRAPDVLPVVALTMVLIVVVGSLIGLLLPFLLTKVGLDPATASAPLVTSLADISGVIIYFSIATRVLDLG
jgi:magnesium transporter